MEVPNILDIKQESTEPFVISFMPSERYANVNGFVHGGILFYVCDDIIGRYVTAMGRTGAAADGNIHYYRPAEVNKRLFANINERKSGKRLGTYFVELKNEDDILIADAMFTVVFNS